MRCPSCGGNDYFELISKDCANPGCIYYNKGTINGVAAMEQQGFDFRGFVVIRPERVLPTEEYVFATRADGTRWREINGLDGPVREVRAVKPFKWQPSRGTVRGIIMADRIYDVYETVPNPMPAGRSVCVVSGEV